MTLSINISNCPCHCPGCHSSYLWQDIGEPLTPMVLEQFIQKYEDEITCICFMGGDAEPKAVNDLAVYIKHLGCLKDMTTNQRLYKRVSGDEFSDITSRFWRKKD